MSTLNEGEYVRLDERLDAANEKIASLDGQLKATKKTSWWQTASPWTALVAFLISLSSAGFTWYDRFWVGPVQDARATMDKLSEIQLTLSKALLEGPQQFQYTMSSVNPQRLGLLMRAVEHFKSRPHLLTGADQLLIGNELINMGDPATATEVADVMIASTDDQLAQAYAKLMKANALRALSPIRDLSQARVLLVSAREQAKVTAAPAAIGVLMDVQAGRILVEVMDEECTGAQDVVNQLGDELDERNVPRFHRDTTRSNIEQLVETTSDLCVLDYSAIAEPG